MYGKIILTENKVINNYPRSIIVVFLVSKNNWIVFRLKKRNRGDEDGDNNGYNLFLKEIWNNGIQEL